MFCLKKEWDGNDSAITDLSDENPAEKSVVCPLEYKTLKNHEKRPCKGGDRGYVPGPSKTGNACHTPGPADFSCICCVGVTYWRMTQATPARGKWGLCLRKVPTL